MKLCFVKLASPYLEYQFSDPPLGLLYTLAACEAKGYDCCFFDMGWETEIPKADVYGISSTTLDYEQAKSVARKIKERDIRAKTILGGTHASMFGMSLDDPEFDVFYVGEGERLPEYLESYCLANARYCVADRITDLDSLPFPARHFVRKDLYFSAPTVFGGEKIGQGNTGTVLTSRGCSFNCAFCGSPKLWGRKTYWRSPENVLKEIDHLVEEYNVGTIRFQDDNLTLDIPRLRVLCNGLKDREIFWRCSTRTNLVNKELMDMFWEGGCREIGFGIESAENHVLKLMKKGLTVETQLNGILMAKEYGFRVRVFAMTGLPGETKNSADLLIDFIDKVKPNTVTLNTFMPIPGSAIWDNPEAFNGEVIEKDFTKYDFTLKWDKNKPFGFKTKDHSLEDMEENREKLKRYIFNNHLCSCLSYNKEYK